MSKPHYVRSVVGSAKDEGLKFADLRRSDFLDLQVRRLPLAYIAVDDQFRVLEWNPAAEKTFGYTKEEAVGHMALDLILPLPVEDRVSEVIRRLRGGDMEAHSVNANRTKSGRLITCEWFNTPLMDSDGHFVGVVSLAEDVTEKKALEEQLQQSQKLEAVGRLAAGIAHDFSGFATTISICTHLLGELVSADARVQQLLKEVSKAAERSTSLTRQLLAFSRQQVLAPRIVSLNDVVEDAEDMLRRLMPENVQFIVHLDPALEPVLVDPAQLERVLLNLVVNARDAMPDGGTLTVATGALAADESTEADLADAAVERYAVLTVTDSGIGMSEETQRQIFEPFFTTKEPSCASGLGLSVVDGIIKQSGGHVLVESQPGKGTCFKICLPCAAGS